jgi:SAM-dependent methyltransferase
MASSGERACPACGGTLGPWRSAPAAEPAIKREFELLRCAQCRSAVTAGEPVEEIHEQGSYAGPPRGAGIAAPILRAFDRRRLRMLRSVAPPPGRLLDVGAGRGRFVAAAAAAGYEASGIEPAPARAAAADQLGARVAVATAEDAEIADGSLDAISLWHVLEHTEEPLAALERMAGWLRPGGAIVIGVPNLASLQARLGGPRWFHFDLPRHRTHFTPAGLEALVHTAGLEPVRTHHVLLEHNPFGMWQSLVSRLTPTPSYLFNLLKRAVPPRPLDLLITVLALPLVPLAVLLELGAGAARRGGTIALVARRPG